MSKPTQPMTMRSRRVSISTSRVRFVAGTVRFTITPSKPLAIVGTRPSVRNVQKGSGLPVRRLRERLEMIYAPEEPPLRPANSRDPCESTGSPTPSVRTSRAASSRDGTLPS
jgi:hypothetical protein